ncbi:helix-turn-helix domain-containing protein [Sphaerisporangium perillae]|uniref:helix-turn-helix domain-containing protein n=1 Tax=Sphaerisporangium perillae TaxID=2935860 RepID=UPI00200E1645|nr:helix-turn-helix domain-containing protein [Sphaerisporangium perillae]
MANVSLRRAMQDAKITEHHLAERCGVDVKTVARWVQDETRIPHQRHQWSAAEALGVDSAVLWPEAIRNTVKTGPDREVLSVYPYRSACPKSIWRNLISSAVGEITLAGYTNYFLWLEHPNLAKVLRRKTEQGCKVRFLVGDPDSEVTRRREEIESVPLTVSTRIRITLAELEQLRDVPGVEARFSDEHIAMSAFRFDSEMLVTPHLAKLVGHDSPMLHLKRHQDDGLFDRFAYHISELWSAGRAI